MASIIMFAVVGLLAYGGYALWRDNFGSTKADSGCYWLLREPGDVRFACLVDDPMRGDCFHADQVDSHRVMCAPNEQELADFTQKAGRKLCSPVVMMCPQPKPR